jgi:hypothetical protein
MACGNKSIEHCTKILLQMLKPPNPQDRRTLTRIHKCTVSSVELIKIKNNPLHLAMKTQRVSNHLKFTMQRIGRKGQEHCSARSKTGKPASELRTSQIANRTAHNTANGTANSSSKTGCSKRAYRRPTEPKGLAPAKAPDKSPTTPACLLNGA